jgi:hypothetical protein
MPIQKPSRKRDLSKVIEVNNPSNQGGQQHTTP